ncbi:EpsG family protein [Advenella sp. WQ 585]|uniref:EpsG family protein n=1 Tax=Advenella mandrilli TaxID=2800330 RepID=A0ABS1EEU7_9BURK|nr:EpsG family protein [Advenella mandrilli]MBK1781745.1 EpsG family protein [Advenella mandrilli]
MLIKKAFNRNAFWLPLITLALFAGIRSSRVGTDSGAYVWDFVSQLDTSYFKFNSDGEFGYQLLVYGLLHLTHNYFWLFFISGLIVVYCYLKTLNKYSINYTLSIFLFITLGSYTFFFNGLRQGLAMAIFTLATPYLLEKKLIPYIFICAIASLFHTSALFMLPFYFITNTNIKLIYKILGSFILSLLSSSLIINYFASTNKRYEGYAQVSESAGGLITLAFFILIAIFLYFIQYYYKIKDQIYTKLFTFYICGVSLIIPIAMLETSASGPQRFLSYFQWTLILLFPFAFKKINTSFATGIFIFLSLFYFLMRTSRFSNLTPYLINPIFDIL